MKEKARYERKLYFPDGNPEELESAIRTNPYGFIERYEKRIVNSIYYETESFHSYMDNENGHENRVKFRTRWYGEDPNPNKTAVHELKIKKGTVGFKVYEDPNINSVYLDHLLKITTPILKVSYIRKYFESFDKKVRITVDSEISYLGLQKYASSKNPVFEKGCVVEIKYNPKEDRIVSNILSGFNHRIDKFSKYARGIKACYS